jgi:hypothetical protein
MPEDRPDQRLLICEKLMALVLGILRLFLMILAPPGSAKTAYVSRLFPAWYFVSHPRSNIIAVSHIATLAETNSGHVQRYVRDNSDMLGYNLTNDSKSNWATSNGCEYHAVGADGAVRGFRADLIIIDDPIKDRGAAESATARNDPQANLGFRSVAGTGTIQPCRIFRQWRSQGQGGRHRSDRVTLVERPNRRTDHQA